MPLQAERLPPEIWLYIFTFIEGHDVVQAFSHLNVFFDSLLLSPHLQLHIRIKQNESSKRLPGSTWSYINVQNIYSLSVSQRKANCLIQFLRWNAKYLIRLRSVSVYLRKSNLDNIIQSLTSALQQIPSLNRIRIKYIATLNPYIDYFEPLMVYIFSAKSSIQKCSFNFRMFYYRMKTSEWSINPSLKYLDINTTSWIDLFSFLTCTPQLYSLQARMNFSDGVSYKNIILTHLEKVNLHLYRSCFTQLELFKEVAPNLKSLRLQGYFDVKDVNYFNENLWHKLFNNIKYFHVNIEGFVGAYSEKDILRNHIRDYHEKSWFNWEENKQCLQIFIKFTSVAI